MDALEITGLVHAYGPQRVLDGVDLTLHAGEFAALIGPNGSGKTTLLRCLAGILQPQHGRIVIAGAEMGLDALAAKQRLGFAVDPTLLTRLNVKPGAHLTIGNATIEIAAVLANEPDKLASGIAFGPRVIISEAALKATGLVQPGSLVRHHYRLAVPNGSDRAAEAVVANAAKQLPDAGWETRSRSNASPALERNTTQESSGCGPSSIPAISCNRS